MEDIDKALGAAVGYLVDENYAQSLAFYRFWFDIGRTHHQIPPDQILDAIWNNRGTGSPTIDPGQGKLVHATAHLIIRFARDVESDHLLAPHSSGLQSRLCARTLQEFFSSNLRLVWSRMSGCEERYLGNICVDANLTAHWVNLGYVEEAVIRNHILQSLISHPILYDHQADALIILFKLAGATFEAYADPSVVNRCFELLKDHKYYNRYLLRYNAPRSGYRSDDLSRGNDYDLMKSGLVQVRDPRPAKDAHKTEASFQEVVALRERGWEGLPPPPVFTTGGLDPTGANSAATPVAISQGLPTRELEPQIPQSPPLESVAAPESDAIPASPVTPVTQSPSISIATLSDFAIADTFDDEFPTDPTIADASDDTPPTDPMAATTHEAFYLEDGNVEVLCGDTLFRVHTTILSFHSPALRRIFAHTNLAMAESPNGCPRILSSDTPKDFATLLKMIYLPGFVAMSVCR